MVVRIDASGGVARLERQVSAARSPRPLLAQFGATIQDSIDTTFATRGRPRWVDNAPSTIRKKGFNDPLHAEQGRRSRLQDSEVRVTDRTVEVRTTRAVQDYAAIHQYGGRAGRGGNTVIPQRKYREIRPEDERKMAAQTQEYLTDAAR